MACDDYRDDLIDWLYDEAAPLVRRRAEAHLLGCEACAEEMAAFRRVRRGLTAWRVPERASAPALAAAPAAPAATRLLPIAAAAVLALGAAWALSGSEVRAGGGTLAVTFGRAAAPLEDRIAAALAAAEARHEARIASLRKDLGAAPTGDAALLEQVRQIVRESEARQAVATAAGLSDLAERTEEQRRYDIAQMSAGLSYVEGKTGLQVARTTELMGHVLQASQKR